MYEEDRTTGTEDRSMVRTVEFTIKWQEGFLEVMELFYHLDRGGGYTIVCIKTQTCTLNRVK